MPKIIENLQKKLVEEARRQIEQDGYSAVTIRSVATACGVGVGTVYNYFPSKDALLATYMLEDWHACMEAITRVSLESSEPAPVLEAMYEQLLTFVRHHEMVFRDEAAAASFARSFSQYHGLLRRQLTEPLEKFCIDSFQAEFVAEAMLTWTMAGKEFHEICGIICKLF